MLDGGPFQLSKDVGNAVKHVLSKLDQTAIAGPSHLHQQLGPKGLWSNPGTASGSSYLQGEVSSCQQLSSQCSCPRIYHSLCCSCLRSIPASCSLLLSISQYLSVCCSILPLVFSLSLCPFTHRYFFLPFSLSLPPSGCSPPHLSVASISFSISVPLAVPFLLFSLSSILPVTLCISS